MTTYFATFIPGFTQVVKKALQRKYGDTSVKQLFESSVLFETDDNFHEVVALPLFNSVFLVLNVTNPEKEKQNGSIVKELFKSTDHHVIEKIQNVFPGHRSFRMMVQKGSELIHIPKDFTKKISLEIHHILHMPHTPLKADLEFWFLLRKENIAIFGVKSLKNRTTSEVHAGQLEPKIAHLLNLLSNPRPDDIYLDPFAGYGALPLSRIELGAYQQIYCSDKDKLQVRKLQNKTVSFKNVNVTFADVSQLTYLPDNLVNKIVTDPPWGLFQMQKVNYVEFYTKMLTEFKRVMQPKGIMIILTAKTEEFESALAQFEADFQLQTNFSTLVNGKKANVYKIISL